MASSTSFPMGYIHAGPASLLASETRAITLSDPVLQALNSFLDELLLSTLQLIGPSSASTAQHGQDAALPLPLQTIHLKDGLLAVFARAKGNNQTLAREALLEAELEVREWIRTKGHHSDPALSMPSLSRKTSHAARPELESVDGALNRSAAVSEIFAELRKATSALSNLGARAAFHNSPGARANVALNLAGKGQLLLVTPLLAIYASCIVNYIAAYLVKGCARIVERSPGSSEATLGDLYELMDEDRLLADVWRATVRANKTIPDAGA